MRLEIKLLAIIIIPLIFINSIYAQPTDNVVSYYPFNGNTYDVTGKGKDISNSGATLTSDRLGKTNAAYNFNGTNSLMYLPSNLLTDNSSFAISCWVNIAGNHSTSDAGQTLIDLRGQYQIAVSYFQPNHPTTPGCFSFYIYSSPTTAALYSPYNSTNLNTWYHLVGNYGNNSMEFYVNGVLVGGPLASNPPGTVSGYNNTIGKDYNVGLNRSWVYGNIDEVIFYKRKLTSAEVLAIYNKELTQSEIPELYGQTNYSYDASGNRSVRNVISLKSAFYFVRSDTISDEMKLVGKSVQPTIDSLKYTDLDQKLRIYPNPTKDQVKIDLKGFDLSQKSVIYVYNSSGLLIQQKVPASSMNEIDLAGYSNGIYILRIIIGDKVSEWKILKE